MMPDSIEKTPAILPGLFRGSDASLWPDWIDSVADGLSNTALRQFLVSMGTPSASKMRAMYGHLHTKTQMKLTPGRY
jgi:hypothetical protein